jgi:hypothetical protein
MEAPQCLRISCLESGQLGCKAWYEIPDAKLTAQESEIDTLLKLSYQGTFLVSWAPESSSASWPTLSCFPAAELSRHRCLPGLSLVQTGSLRSPSEVFICFSCTACFSGHSGLKNADQYAASRASASSRSEMMEMVEFLERRCCRGCLNAALLSRTSLLRVAESGH